MTGSRSMPLTWGLRMSELPNGWTEVTFEDVVEVNPRKSIDLSADDLVTFVPMAAVDEVSGTIARPVERPLRDVSKGFTQFAENDVIFAKITPSMENGKSAVAAGLVNGIGFGSTEFHVFRSNGAVLPEFLWRFVRQEEFRDNAQRVMSGAVGQQRVPAEYLKAHPLPLPPFTEQKRIVAKISTLTARTTRARIALDRIPALVAKYKQRTLEFAFSGRLTSDWRQENAGLGPVTGRDRSAIRAKLALAGADDFEPPFAVPANWRWLALPELGDMDRGKSRHRPRNDRRLFGGPYPFVQTGDVRAADRYLTTFDETYSKFGLAQSRLWPVGTVCITIAANIAETTILGIEACFPDSIVGFLADPDKVSPDYVEFFIRTVRDDLSAFAPATAQKNINLGVLAAVRLPVPPPAEQAEIIRRIEAAFAWLDRVSDDHASASRLLSRLDSAIFIKAFRGELVPPDPNDESADALLKRVKLQQASRPPRVRKPVPRAKSIKEEHMTSDRNLEQILIEAADWVPAQTAFQRCGIGDGASTEDIELLYGQLRDLDKAGKLEVEAVLDNQGRKIYDRIRLKAV